MKVVQLKISNFRGIKDATLNFNGHTLLVGANNVGKSTICEALDLVLGVDRLKHQPPVDEHDFYNSEYLTRNGETEEPTCVRIRIEVVLIELTPEIENLCGANIEFWHREEKRILGIGEADVTTSPAVIKCLRVECLGAYSPDEDDFQANTYFSHSPNSEDGLLSSIPQRIKKQFGFLYLRALRTGSRALSLERGSLLDIILRLKEMRAGLWESTIAKLKSVDVEEGAGNLRTILSDVEERLKSYIPSFVQQQSTSLQVSQLTREHLRKTLAFFLAISADQVAVPFQHAGTGTLNTLVLALLSIIAELKKDSVIFAMEEPEIAVPPHTQRRIVEYLTTKTTQALITSHSPYVIDRFSQNSIVIVKRTTTGSLTSTLLADVSDLADNDFRRYSQRGLAECMLAEGVIVVEGITEYFALPIAARILAASDPTLLPFDISGVSFFDAESDGKILKVGKLLIELGHKTFTFHDTNPQLSAKQVELDSTYTINRAHSYSNFEKLLANETPIGRIWAFLEEIREGGEDSAGQIPSSMPSEVEQRKILVKLLAGKKGAGWAARLIESCSASELPSQIVTFLRDVHVHFPKPALNVSPTDDANQQA